MAFIHFWQHKASYKSNTMLDLLWRRKKNFWGKIHRKQLILQIKSEFSMRILSPSKELSESNPHEIKKKKYESAKMYWSKRFTNERGVHFYHTAKADAIYIEG